MSSTQCEFFKDSHSGLDMAREWVIGDKSDVYLKVKDHPRLIEQYPEAWRRYQADQPQDEIDGTPLSEIGISAGQATRMSLEGLRTVEQLAACGEHTVVAMGAGMRQFWKAAQLHVKAKEADEMRARLEKLEAKPKRGRPRKKNSEKTEETPDDEAAA